MEKTFKNKQGAPRFNALIPELHVSHLEAPFGRGISFEIEMKALEPVLGFLQAESYPLWREPHFCEYEWCRREG